MATKDRGPQPMWECRYDPKSKLAARQKTKAGRILAELFVEERKKSEDFPDEDLRSLWGQTKKTQPTSLTKTPPGSLQADEDVDTEETLPEESQSIIPIRMCTLHCVLAFEEDQPMTVNGSEDQNSCYEVPAVKDPTADDPEDSCSLFRVRCNH
ncbi:hypothetical protein E4U30_002408 [Claviceps sp. LM220 group G6]|nr:hypothetical protein E4U30_002408 [Claviceps sp. LM220 group G6]